MPLYVTVTPGVTVTDDTVIDASVANRLASPTVDISGTVDGESAVTLSAGAVTNDKMANMTGPSVKGKRTGTGSPEDVTIDNSTIEIYDNSGTPTMRVKSLGIDTAQLDAASVTAAKIADQIITPTKLAPQKPLTVLANPGATVTSGAVPVTIGSGLTISGVTEVTISNRAKASGTATITTASAHGFSTGDYVSVTTAGGTGYNATRVAVTASSTTVFTYSIQNTDTETTADDAGTCMKVAAAAGTNSGTLAVSYSSPYVARIYGLLYGPGNGTSRWASATFTQSGTTVTITSASHGIPNGAIVSITFPSGPTSGNAFVAANYTTNTFTVTVASSATIASTSCTINCAAYGGNISAIQRTGTGAYTLTWANVAMTTGDYAVIASGKSTSTSADIVCAASSGLARASTSYSFLTHIPGSGARDFYEVSMAIFGS